MVLSSSSKGGSSYILAEDITKQACIQTAHTRRAAGGGQAIV